MGLWDAVTRFMALEPMQELTIDPFAAVPDLGTQMAAIRVNQDKARPWRSPSVSEALGFPAILRAVTLISGTTGSLSIQGIRDGEPMKDAPRIITRPDPFRTPQAFYRDMAWQMATRGETICWIASRDYNEQPTALVIVPLAEMSVTENERNRLFPIYEWLALDRNGRKTAGTIKSTRYSPANPTGAFVHVTYLQEPGELRGAGPLQICGAAASVAVEAQEWAANFFASGGYPSLDLHSDVDLSPDEAAALKAQWIATPSNMPKVTNPTLTVKEFGANPASAQMMESRDYQNGDAARMFGIPGSLLDYSSPGSSLTYQNIEGEFTKFVRGCLAISYLSPIEQALSDLLPRSIISRFYVDGLLRADIKTRYEVYASGIDSGILDIPTAQKMEGLSPGNIERAPVPASPPAAVPGGVPIQQRSFPQAHLSQGEVRCNGRKRMPDGQFIACTKLLAESGPFIGRCPRCHKSYPAAA